MEVREQVALDSAQALELLRVIRREEIFPEAMVLSTCNRTEIYFVARPDAPDAMEHLLRHIAQIKGAPVLADTSSFFRLRGPAAVERLFAVAGSLESQIVGEHEILGQVKEAYRLACEARTAGFLLHRLFHAAFRCAKRVMTQTRLGQGTASVSQAAVDLAGQIFQDLSGKCVMLIGAGQTAELAAQALVRAGATKLIVANRTLYRAEQLAGDFIQWRLEQAAAATHVKCPALIQLNEQLPPASAQPSADLEARAIELDQVLETIAQADLVISSTGAPEPILTHEKLSAVLGKLRKSLLLIDIAVPRDIDPRLATFDNVFLYNIDDLEGLVAANLKRRESEMTQANAIVADEAAAFDRWLDSLDIVPTIKLLVGRMEQLQQAEIERLARKLPSAQREVLAELARSLTNKMVHDPITALREIAGDSSGVSGLQAIDLFRKMFRLDDAEGGE